MNHKQSGNENRTTKKIPIHPFVFGKYHQWNPSQRRRKTLSPRLQKSVTRRLLDTRFITGKHRRIPLPRTYLEVDPRRVYVRNCLRRQSIVYNERIVMNHPSLEALCVTRSRAGPWRNSLQALSPHYWIRSTHLLTKIKRSSRCAIKTQRHLNFQKMKTKFLSKFSIAFRFEGHSTLNSRSCTRNGWKIITTGCPVQMIFQNRWEIVLLPSTSRIWR